MPYAFEALSLCFKTLSLSLSLLPVLFLICRRGTFSSVILKTLTQRRCLAQFQHRPISLSPLLSLNIHTFLAFIVLISQKFGVFCNEPRSSDPWRAGRQFYITDFVIPHLGFANASTLTDPTNALWVLFVVLCPPHPILSRPIRRRLKWRARAACSRSGWWRPGTHPTLGFSCWTSTCLATMASSTRSSSPCATWPLVLCSATSQLRGWRWCRCRPFDPGSNSWRSRRWVSCSAFRWCSGTFRSGICRCRLTRLLGPPRLSSLPCLPTLWRSKGRLGSLISLSFLLSQGSSLQVGYELFLFSLHVSFW